MFSALAEPRAGTCPPVPSLPPRPGIYLRSRACIAATTTPGVHCSGYYSTAARRDCQAARHPHQAHHDFAIHLIAVTCFFGFASSITASTPFLRPLAPKACLSNNATARKQTKATKNPNGAPRT